MGRSRKRLGKSIGAVRRRSHDVEPLPTRHIVLCEGKTEQRCIDGLRVYCRISNVDVQVLGQEGVPSTLVAKAKKLEGKRTKGRQVVHVVFDCDDHPCFRKAIDMLRYTNVRKGISVPCFELWAILLHDDQTAHISSREAQRRLRDLHPGYDHDSNPFLDIDAVLRGLDDARKRAGDLEHRARDAEDAYHNPSTTVPAVIDEIFGDALRRRA